MIGYEFDVDLLADVVDKRADDVLDATRCGTAAGLVIQVGIDRDRFAQRFGARDAAWRCCSTIDPDRTIPRRIRQLEGDIDGLLDAHGTTLRVESGFRPFAGATPPVKAATRIAFTP